ncbi:MAG: helix-turn-helix transcriptional regulator [Candidatus Doudnabacteria bacterium]|nr:helix-turn-helix transcriptional regulator [Candidatus Doudnabacteria bacterium]
MKELENILKALANRRRLYILQFLKIEREASVQEVARAIRLSFKATSKHLNILARADLLEREQRNLNVFYSINSKLRPFVKSLLIDL